MNIEKRSKNSWPSSFTIYIQTYGRPHRQPTAEALEAEGIPFTFVVQKSERKKYKEIAKHLNASLLVLPSHIRDLASTREWQIYNCPTKYFCWLDDDIQFFRRSGDGVRLRKLKKGELRSMFVNYLYNWLHYKRFAHAGISMREGNNHVPEYEKRIGRMCRVLAYNRDILQKQKVEAARTICREDFDITLQLLKAGFPNMISYEFAQNQIGGSNHEGGCSGYRDWEMLKWSAEKLAELHPGFVRVVERETKSSWGGGVRHDVTIQWKKAYQQRELGLEA